MSRVFLLLLMAHLWCAEDCQEVRLTVPCVWTRQMDDCGQTKCFSVQNPRNSAKSTVMDLHKGDLVLVADALAQNRRGRFYIPHLRPLEHGEVLSAQILSEEEGFRTGSAMYTSESKKEGCLFIKPPGEFVQTVSVDLQNATLPDVFCEYSAQEHHFIITRPLVEYVDKSLFFVRLKIAYDNTRKPIMMWGKRGPTNDEGSFQEWGIKQKVFDFCPQDTPCDPHQGDGDDIGTSVVPKTAIPVKRKGLLKTVTKSSRGRKSSARGGVKRLQN